MELVGYLALIVLYTYGVYVMGHAAGRSKERESFEKLCDLLDDIERERREGTA